MSRVSGILATLAFMAFMAWRYYYEPHFAALAGVLGIGAAITARAAIAKKEEP